MPCNRKAGGKPVRRNLRTGHKPFIPPICHYQRLGIVTRYGSGVLIASYLWRSESIPRHSRVQVPPLHADGQTATLPRLGRTVGKSVSQRFWSGGPVMRIEGSTPSTGTMKVSGEECQCVQCEEIFTSLSAFDLHQHWRDDTLTCLPPADIGLKPVERRGGSVWSLPGPEEGGDAMVRVRRKLFTIR